MDLPKAYQPKENEDNIYRRWEESGYFNPDNLTDRLTESFSIVIPPPNITGELHMGHALNAFVQDCLIRFKRMQGYKTLWLPGTDHAGIATQNVVEKKLKKEGKSRHDLGREKFLEEVWQWQDQYGNRILEQLRKLGASCDWSRCRFTMDEDYQQAVEAAFLHYHKQGLIYQGDRVINWCPRCQTSLSDLELDYREEKGHLWHIIYPLKEPTDKLKQIVVATTRPETMLGDTAVAVNPKDERYKEVVGKTLILPIVNKEIPIIADRLVESEFGTGAVKVTPAHDLADFEIGQRHKLEIIQVISETGQMTQKAGPEFAGLKVLEARQKIIQQLTQAKLLIKTEDYSHRVSHCYRCDSVIEPLLSKQWFVKMDHLAKLAIAAVKNKEIRFHPSRFEKVYLDWLKNIKDWCISRQIWWGHKIPLEGVDDVMDTWFSSALWPFATLGWPQKTKDLETYYPTNVLVTARDIINLWVARMVYSGLEFTGQKPFSDVYIHATILTKDGKRMSKSLGTGIDPLDLIEKYGADATRFGFLYQSLGGQDMKFSDENMLMGKKFSNKVWNASRFVLSKIDQLEKEPVIEEINLNNLSEADKEIIQKTKHLIKSTTQDLEKYQFGQAAHNLYDFFWHDFCDNYIEHAKNQQGLETSQVLAWTLLTCLKLLHPFLPFVSEAIYQQIPFKQKEFLMIATWPK